MLADSALNAIHDSEEVASQDFCHPGTRVPFIARVREWVQDSDTSPLVSLYAPAGAGKSTIMRTVAQKLAAEGRLSADSFFLRGGERRHSAQHFVATLAHQITLSLPDTQPLIADSISKNPAIFSKSLRRQADLLLVQPLLAIRRSEDSPFVFLVDGVDECVEESQEDVMNILCSLAQLEVLNIRVIVASRPEPQIRRILEDFEDSMDSMPGMT